MNTRFALISDIHSNIEAFRAVLKDIRATGVEEIYCLGDVVGYGPDPEETVKLARSVADGRTVLGNHDFATLHADSEYVYGFNPSAIAAVIYQRDHLSAEAMEWLGQLPETIRRGDVLFCHGSPADTDQYLLNDDDYQAAFDEAEAQGARLIFFGHTHVPVIARTCGAADIEYRYLNEEPDRRHVEIKLDQNCTYLINPGSVGQPRDRHPDAAWALVDLTRNTVQFRRTAYDIAAVQRKILAAGLPPHLASRLEIGH